MNSPHKFIAKLKTESRGGKIVTLIDDLPKQEIFLRDLAAELKKKCGSGGTYDMSKKEGRIEIQGDKRDMIRALLEKKNISVKG